MTQWLFFFSLKVLAEWNKGELDSFLIEITKDILAYKDSDGSPLVEKIRDAAGQVRRLFCFIGAAIRNIYWVLGVRAIFTLGTVYSTSASGAEQTTETKIIQIKHNIVKNPNWSEANQLVIYMRDRGFEFRATKKQIQVVASVGLKPRIAGLWVRHTDHLATLPPLRGLEKRSWNKTNFKWCIDAFCNRMV